MTESRWQSVTTHSIALRNDRGNAGGHQNHRVTPPARVALGALPAFTATLVTIWGHTEKTDVIRQSTEKQKNEIR